jgi:hypothetical protein
LTHWIAGIHGACPYRGHGADIFTDVFLLVEVDGKWRIANKAYHRWPG